MDRCLDAEPHLGCPTISAARPLKWGIFNRVGQNQLNTIAYAGSDAALAGVVGEANTLGLRIVQIMKSGPNSLSYVVLLHEH